MKGYIVGYFAGWADSRNPMIIGYYTSWNKSVAVAMDLERNNLDKENGLLEVYIAEIDVNKTYNAKKCHLDWINNFVHHRIKTTRGKTVLHGPKGQTVLNLPETTVWQEAKPKRRRNYSKHS